jgi:hypothetical protein
MSTSSCALIPHSILVSIILAWARYFSWDSNEHAVKNAFCSDYALTHSISSSEDLDNSFQNAFNLSMADVTKLIS